LMETPVVSPSNGGRDTMVGKRISQDFINPVNIGILLP
jgi:hypothetical protein